MNILRKVIAATFLAVFSLVGSLGQASEIPESGKKQEKSSAAEFNIKEFKELTAKLQRIAENSARVEAKLDEMGVPKKQQVIDDMTAWLIQNYRNHGGADWLRMRKSYLDNNPEGIPSAVIDAVGKGEILRGMTREQVFLAWVKIPKKIIKSVDASGQRERCVYDFNDVNARSSRNNGVDTRRINYPPDTAET